MLSLEMLNIRLIMSSVAPLIEDEVFGLITILGIGAAHRVLLVILHLAEILDTASATRAQLLKTCYFIMEKFISSIRLKLIFLMDQKGRRQDF